MFEDDKNELKVFFTGYREFEKKTALKTLFIYKLICMLFYQYYFRLLSPYVFRL